MTNHLIELHFDSSPLGGVTLDGLLAEFDRLDQLLSKEQENFGALIVRSGNEWLERSKSKPVPKKLFDCLWFEGEICILFASSNQGKSILAVQIADAISKGRPIPGFRLEADTQPVLYADFEMSEKQFEIRYGDGEGNFYRWSNDFMRAELNPEADLPKGYTNFEDYVIDCIEQFIVQTRTRILVIDNLTYLATNTETAKEAAPLMKKLKQLKTKYDLSLLVLAHTPKRDSSKPLTQNDLQGSSRLIQFCDSCIAIGSSVQGSDVKYLKQLKARNTAYEYDEDNVVICQIKKTDGFLHFERIGNGKERDHLRTAFEEKNVQRTEVMSLAAQGMTQRDIALTIGRSASFVNRLLKAQST
ncbi:hypothetical protein BN8_00507 [Fibrisoma limi BUZ 3]|uniref:LuxR family transcriptional regulator n=1 Tax=Fibrisoma limi BUZ 3 TaxID=1185876 RepID=I2GCF4_9BACT|nr:AAA family ATPase [Fibrisoma limi]CCH51578.1 hypothetical protein BN8_00507 [Fibrisoma limi BUZ 3]